MFSSRSSIRRMLAMAAIAVGAIAMAGCSPVSQINTGNVGVTTFLGKTSAEELSPGIHFPFASVSEFTAKEVPVSLTDFKPRAKDNMTLHDLDLDIYVQPAADKIADTVIKYKGDVTDIDGEYFAGWNVVIRNAREAVYSSVSQFDGTTMHTKRPELAAEIQRRLQTDLDKSDPGTWMVSSVNVRNLVTDPGLEAAIREAAKRDFEIAAKKKEVELANAESERLRAEAQGRADAAQIEAKALLNAGQEYLRKMELENERAAIAKWDGALPTTSAGGAMPFLNLK